MKGRTAEKETSFVQEDKELEANYAEAPSLSDAALMGRTAYRDRTRHEVDQLAFVTETINVEVRKARQELPGA